MFISYQLDGKCRINTVNQHKILLTKHRGCYCAATRQHFSVAVLMERTSQLKRTAFFCQFIVEQDCLLLFTSEKLACVAYIVHTGMVREFFFFFFSSGYFFFLFISHCTSLKLLCPPGRLTPALQKFRTNSRTNKVFTAKIDRRVG